MKTLSQGTMDLLDTPMKPAWSSSGGKYIKGHCGGVECYGSL